MWVWAWAWAWVVELQWTETKSLEEEEEEHEVWIFAKTTREPTGSKSLGGTGSRGEVPDTLKLETERYQG